MKAIRVREFGPPEVMQLEDVSEPAPADGQLRIAIRAAGVNPVDTYIRSGTYAQKPELPYTPGFDGAGEVAAVGKGVKEFREGDRVYVAGSLTGTYAEQVLCQASQVHPLPENTSFEEGAALGIPYATAYRALFQRARARPGETLLVHGASGGVGTAAVQLARAGGLKVIGTAGSEAGRELVRRQGAHLVADHGDPHYLDEIRSWVDEEGLDLILEMLANVNLARDLQLLATGGRVVVIGSRDRIEIDPRDIMARDADILGMILFKTPDAEMRQIHAALVAGLENGTLKPVIRQSLSLSRASKSHQIVMESGAYGNIALMT